MLVDLLYLCRLISVKTQQNVRDRVLAVVGNMSAAVSLHENRRPADDRPEFQQVPVHVYGGLSAGNR